MKGFPWRYGIYFLLAVYLFADLYGCHGPLHRRIIGGAADADDASAFAATVYGRPITRLELQEAMRAHLWRRGEHWESLSTLARQQTRWLVLENLVNDRMIHAFRIKNGLDKVPSAQTTRDEYQAFLRQFEESTEGESRLAMQFLDKQSMTRQLQDSIEDEAWIEEKIAHRMAEITKQTAREWYDANRDSLAVPPAWHAAHIYLTRHDATKPDREPEIREIHRKLLAGEATFEQVAASEANEDLRARAKAGDLGWFTRDRMPEDFIAAIEGLPIGTLSNPVPTRLGWHIIRVQEMKPGRISEFAEVKDEVLAMLLNQRREAAVKSLIGELREKSLSPNPFLIYHRQVIDTAEPAGFAPEPPAQN